MKGAPRKLRKSCSLPTCSKTPGECMHCTCDGRCGQHDAGRCGVRREGNGKSCKRDGCAKDASCLHSTRATCCHCRNLVSSSNRSSRKRTRAELDEPSAVAAVLPLDDEPLETPLQAETVEADSATTTDDHAPVAKTAVEGDVDGASSPTSCDALLPLAGDIFGDFEICDDLLVVIKKPRTEGPVASTEPDQDSRPTPSSVTPKSLCEYDQYAARRGTSNLVVLVEGTQFNLHKHPMLLESQLLNAKAREALLTSQGPVPVVQLNSFPGGAAAFEAACVYAYTGELSFAPDAAAALYSAVHYLNMGLAATTRARQYLSTITSQPGHVDALLRVTRDASELMDKHDSLSVCAELHLECVDALARVLPLELSSMDKLLAFPIELFLQVTQEMLATRGPQELAADMVRQLCVQAELAQLHRDQTDKKADAATVSASQRCLTLLEQSLAPTPSTSSTPPTASLGGLKGGSPSASAGAHEEDDDALFMKMMYDFEMDPSSDDDESSSGAFADALSVAALEPLAFASNRSHRGAFSAAAFAV